MDVKNLIEKYRKAHSEHPRCEGCGATIQESDASDVEYVKTKRRSELFIHKGCVNKVWG